MGKSIREAARAQGLQSSALSQLILDAFALRVRSAGTVVSVPVLGVVGVLGDGRKQLLALDLCAGESFAAWKGCLGDLVTRGLQARTPSCNAAVSISSATSSARHQSMSSLRFATIFIASHMPRAPTEPVRRTRPLNAYGPSVVRAWWRACGKAATNSSRSSGFPKHSGKRYARRTRSSDFSLVASGQIRLRRIDGWRKIATVLRQHTPVAA
jgi:hypothetical protein